MTTKELIAYKKRNRSHRLISEFYDEALEKNIHELRSHYTRTSDIARKYGRKRGVGSGRFHYADILTENITKSPGILFIETVQSLYSEESGSLDNLLILLHETAIFIELLNDKICELWRLDDSYPTVVPVHIIRTFISSNVMNEIQRLNGLTLSLPTVLRNAIDFQKADETETEYLPINISRLRRKLGLMPFLLMRSAFQRETFDALMNKCKAFIFQINGIASKGICSEFLVNNSSYFNDQYSTKKLQHNNCATDIINNLWRPQLSLIRNYYFKRYSSEKKLDSSSSGCTNVDLITCKICLEQIFNASIYFLLRVIIDRRTKMSKNGGYILFGDISILQNFVEDCKALIGTSSNERIIEDVFVWKKAESVVRLLTRRKGSVGPIKALFTQSVLYRKQSSDTDKKSVKDLDISRMSLRTTYSKIGVEASDIVEISKYLSNVEISVCLSLAKAEVYYCFPNIFRGSSNNSKIFVNIELNYSKL